MTRKPVFGAVSLSSLASALMLIQSSVSAEVQELDALVVTASGTEHTQLTAPAFTSVIDEQTLRDNPSASVVDLISRNVGVINATDGNGRDEVRIRGLDGGYTLILVDGKRVSSSGALWRGGDFDYSSIPRSSIERIEIVRGPMSSLYGADAMGGVINIITRKASGEWTASLDAMYESVLEGDEGDELRTNLSTAGPLADDVYVRLSGEFYDRDAWYVNNEDDVPEREEKEARNLSGSLSWDIDNRQTLSADVSVNRDERPYGIYSAGPDYRAQEIERETYSLGHEGNWGWGSTRLNVNFEQADVDDFNTRYPAPQQRYLKEENLTVAGSSSFVLGVHGLTAGYEFREQEVTDDVSFTRTGGADAQIQAVYLQDELRLNDRLTMTLGGRYENHDEFDGEFTPRGYLVYRLTDGVSLKGGVSTAFKAPGLYQLVEEYQIVSCGGSCFIPGNPDLVPETSTNYEIGAEVDQNRWRMSAVLFRSDVEDMITATYDSATNARAWVNLNEVQLWGLELEGELELSSTVKMDAAYAYLDTEEKGAGELAYHPRHTLNAGVNWQVLESTGLRCGAEYTGGQKNYSAEKQPSYTLFDVSVNSRVAEGLVLRAGINNLTNASLSDDNDDYYSNLVGRSVYAGLSYDF